MGSKATEPASGDYVRVTMWGAEGRGKYMLPVLIVGAVIVCVSWISLGVIGTHGSVAVVKQVLALARALPR